VSAAAQLSAPDVERFRSAVRGRLGLHFDDGRLGALAEVLRRRIAATGRPAAVYLTHLEETTTARDEPRALARELTIAETYFFRNVEQFNALREIVLPERARARSADRRLNILSAGCASGEEAYTLAILFAEVLGIAHPIMQGHIQVGTHLRQRIVSFAVHRERENLVIILEYGRGAVALMDVEIDDGRPVNVALGPQLADRDGDIVEHAESFAMIGEGVMRAAGQVAPESVLERRTRRQQSSGRGKT